jgi:hypothetical protein
MSYQLNCKCGTCTKKENCIDKRFVQAAISGMNAEKWINGRAKQSHLGTGIIEIQCENFNDEEQLIETNNE